MNPTASELEILADLLHQTMADGMIQKITQPGPTRFIIQTHRASVGRTNLLIDVARNAVHFHATSLDFENPSKAPPFCLQLRGLLEHGFVRRVAATPGDRIVTLDVDKKSEDSVDRIRVVLELIPGHPCLLVVAPDDMVLSASGAVHSEKREIARGKPYVPPQLPPGGSPKGGAFDRLGDWSPEDLFGRLDAEVEPATPDGVDLRSIQRAVTREIKRQYKRISKVEGDVRNMESGEDLLHQGELLKSAMGSIARGQDSVEVVDWADPDEKTVEIALDPLLSPSENLSKIFDRARKKVRGIEVATERLSATKSRLQDLLAWQAEVESEEHPPLDMLLARAQELGVTVTPPTSSRKKARAKPVPRRPYFIYRSREDIEIWVGRTSRDNDDLTFRHANGNDWWLHAENYPGSHIVVKSSEDPLPEQTLIDAATLAIHYSKAPSGGKQPVSLTRRKYVTKFKGAAAGKVLLKTHKTFNVLYEPERLDRLESSRG